MAIHRGGSGHPRNTWLLGPTEVCIPNGILIGHAVLAQLMVLFNGHAGTQTHRPRYVCSSRPHDLLFKGGNDADCLRNEPGEEIPLPETTTLDDISCPVMVKL